jgi:hypothetical protein
MVFKTPSVNVATDAETNPTATCPAATGIAALVVEATSASGTPAEAAPESDNASTPPASGNS